MYYPSEVNFSPIWIDHLGHMIMENMAVYPVLFTMLTNNISSNPIPHRVITFLLVLMH